VGQAQFLPAVVFNGSIYTSSDYGVNWTQTSAPSASWFSITSDSTGQYLAAVINNGSIYTSSDYGSTWIQTSAPSAQWNSITSNSTGQYLYAVINNGSIYSTSNYGQTWYQTIAPTLAWAQITSNSFGNRLAAITEDSQNGRILTLTSALPTQFLTNQNGIPIDLSNILQPATAQPTTFPVTNFQVNNYIPLWTTTPGLYDLGQIFSSFPTNPFTVSGGSFTTTTTTVGSTITYNIIINPGTTTITFNVLPDSSFANFQLIGAGGGGGGTWSVFAPYYDIYSGAGGGGGGNLLINNFTVNVSENYTISVGSGGSGGVFGGTSTPATPGTSGGETNIIGQNIDCVAAGGSGGGSGGSGSAAYGGQGGNFTVNTLSSGSYNGGSGGAGGNGSTGTNYTNGQNGVNGYFYNNPSLSYSPSTSYPTFYAPSNAFSPPSVTLTNWDQVSGGGGAANSNINGQFYAWLGGSGRGSGGLNGGNYPVVIVGQFPSPYPSFGGGGGGGSLYGGGFNGGSGLAVVWFSYTD